MKEPKTKVPRILFATALLACVIPLCAQESSSTGPAYTAATIVNSATSNAEALAPNTIATIYGTNLSYETGVASGQPAAGGVPGSLTGVQVFVAGQPAGLYYVSPKQINFLIPPDLRPGLVDLFVARDGVAGPATLIELKEASPGLFESAQGIAVATHADGSVVTKAHPARRGETISVYGTGFGPTTPYQAISAPAPITDLSSFHLLLNKTGVPASSILKVFVAPATPGLYQATFKLPKSVGANPEIRVAIGAQLSPPNVNLPLE